MPRPKKARGVRRPPIFSKFKPAGVKGCSLDQVQLSLDEYEAIRLCDYEGLDHAGAADEMGISRSTFSRLIEKARSKLAGFLIEGKVLSIEGGDIHFHENVFVCSNCQKVFHGDLDNGVRKCPECGSTDITEHAGRFGHGRCCREHWKK